MLNDKTKKFDKKNKIKKIDEKEEIKDLIKELEKKDVTKDILEKAEKYDDFKTKVLKFVLYKKRTEEEVKRRFENEIELEIFEKIIQELKFNNYINDKKYIERVVNDFISLNKLSIKEIKYKLYTKGIKNDLIDTYISENYDKLYLFEINSAKKLVQKRKEDTNEKIQSFLDKKGYNIDIIKKVLEDL